MHLKLVFEGIMGDSYKSYIALDDIITGPTCIPYNQDLPLQLTTSTTTTKNCGENGFQCNDGTCIDNSKVCDFNRDCLNNDDEAECGTCDFENDQCGWYL